MGYLAGWAAPNGGPLDAMDSAQAAAAIRYIYTLTAGLASSCALEQAAAKPDYTPPASRSTLVTGNAPPLAQLFIP